MLWSKKECDMLDPFMSWWPRVSFSLSLIHSFLFFSLKRVSFDPKLNSRGSVDFTKPRKIHSTLSQMCWIDFAVLYVVQLLHGRFDATRIDFGHRRRRKTPTWVAKMPFWISSFCSNIKKNMVGDSAKSAIFQNRN